MPPIYLFDVQKVLGIKGDGRAGDRHILVQGPAVAHVRLHSEGDRFGLATESQRRMEEDRGGFFILKCSIITRSLVVPAGGEITFQRGNSDGFQVPGQHGKQVRPAVPSPPPSPLVLSNIPKHKCALERNGKLGGAVCFVLES